jgi:quercetin 2,3-dioxygenase
MIDPYYQDIQSETIPEVALEAGDLVRVIAGSYQGVSGPVNSIVQLLYLDVRLAAREHAHTVHHPLQSGHNCFVYVYDGEIEVDQRCVSAGNLIVFDKQVESSDRAVVGHEGGVQVTSVGEKPAGYLFVAAETLEQPVVRRGPFVMCTQEDLKQAFIDYQSGALAKMK